jgi:hypothetical protein
MLKPRDCLSDKRILAILRDQTLKLGDHTVVPERIARAVPDVDRQREINKPKLSIWLRNYEVILEDEARFCMVTRIPADPSQNVGACAVSARRQYEWASRDLYGHRIPGKESNKA